MPTKPSNEPPRWAIPGNYTTGPFIGQPRRVSIGAAVANEGHRPGSNFPTTAEEWNDWLGDVGDLARWTFAGTSNPDADTHIVETDADGRISAQLGTFDSSADTTVHTLEVNTDSSTGQAAISATATDVGGVGIASDAEGLAGFFRSMDATYSSGTVTVIQQGTGPGVNAVALVGAAVQGAAGAAAGYGGLFTGNTTGVALRANAANGNGAVGIQAESGTGTASVAVRGTANSASSTGLYGIGGADAYGVLGQTPSGANSGAVAVWGVADDEATGVRGDAGSNAAGIGVYGVATGDANGGIFESEDGRALIASSGGALASFRVIPKVGTPTLQDGDIDYNSTRDQYMCSRDSTVNAFWSTPGGNAEAGDYTQPGVKPTIATGGTYTTLETVTLTNADSPTVSGTKVHIRATAVVEQIAGSVPTTYRIRDTTAPATIVAAITISAQAPAGENEPAFSVEARYVLPATGDRTFVFEATSAGGTANELTYASLTVTGTYSS